MPFVYLNSGANVTIYTKSRKRLSATDIANFNAQYPTLDVEYTEIFHDRFLIRDEALVREILLRLNP